MTSPRAAREITERGVRIAAASPEGVWGQGFYSSTRPDEQFGEALVRVAVRLVHPLVIEDSVAGVELIEDLKERTATDIVRDAVLIAGYGGIIVHCGPGDMWVVAFHDEQVKVVHDGERGR